MNTTDLILLAILLTLLGLWPVVLVVGLAILIGWGTMIVGAYAWAIIKYYAEHWKNL